MTININSWYPFRDRWNAEGEPHELADLQVVAIQEHHLHTQEACGDAQEWLESRGWRAILSRAATLPSGKPSGGVGLLIRQSDEYGLTDPGLSAGEFSHRLCVVRLTASNISPCLVVSMYLEVSGGLNETNRSILSVIAQWQEATQLPVIAAGDFQVA